MTEKIYQVSGPSGGYAELMDWMTAYTVAYEDSKNGSFIVIEDTIDKKIIAIYFNGNMYVSTGGKTCEHCGKALDADQSHYAYILTNHYYCSIKCGKALNVLSDRI